MIPFSITGSEFQAFVILWTIDLCAWRQFSDFLSNSSSSFFFFSPSLQHPRTFCQAPFFFSFILFLLRSHYVAFPIPAYEHDIKLLELYLQITERFFIPSMFISFLPFFFLSSLSIFLYSSFSFRIFFSLVDNY
ncbi:hypothetical protein P170DRAFT_123736 [Aspergillus steynii IBT 23096]|uniref:Uncharacterized protein n=1 Tax=Aspergillus steynii IBT 23096 TaxID=1392250 RepID=A0A2I2GJR7_9EURO|nr:uncharacterized protein P170DRAFT_123736 [Aspergillus steynii IBT 23096]PLB53126.1 hypothetical protein P170DRAFT_123736 [Aspergillus steynii IBT 23096]